MSDNTDFLLNKVTKDSPKSLIKQQPYGQNNHKK